MPEEGVPCLIRACGLRTLLDVPARECSRTACSHPAVSTLTFVYQDSTAVLGPLSRVSEPGAYDLCREHAERLTPPRGWDLLRVPGEGRGDDLVALSDAVYRPAAEAPPSSAAARPTVSSRGGRHLQVVRSPHE